MSVKRRLVSGFCVGVLLVTGSACLSRRFKPKKIEKDIERGLEQVRLHDLKRKIPGRSRPTGRLSPLQADPPALDFGQVPVASATRRVVVIANPLDFAVSVVRVTVEGCGFSLVDPLDQHIIPAHGDLMLTLAFQPVVTGACTGQLLLEIDSASGRFTPPVPLTGRGV